MNSQQLQELIAEFERAEHEVMGFKEGEYTGSANRLRNFERVADMLGLKASQVALAYLLKHIDSISYQVMSGKYTWAMVIEGSREGLKQRVVDAVNYLHLMAACLEKEEAAARAAGEAERSDQDALEGRLLGEDHQV